MNPDSHLLECCANLRNQRLPGEEIDLGQDHNLGFGQKLDTVLTKLTV
jgi:hypothetical protein